MNSRPRLCWKPARKRDRQDRVSLCAMRNIAATLLMAASLAAQPAFYRKDMPVAERPYKITIADFNGDARPDLLMCHLPRMSVLLNRGGGNFGLPIQSNYTCGSSVATADFNGDRRMDVVTGGKVMLGRGDGTFLPPLETEVRGEAVAGDFNGDGRPDLAVGGGPVAVLLGNGDGTFRSGESVGPGGLPRAADFNRDGTDDLVLCCSTVDTLYVLLSEGDGTFGRPVETPFPSPHGANLWEFHIVDFNGDGQRDILTSRGIILGRGDGSFHPPVSFDSSQGSYPYPSGAADFDGDGILDMIVSYWHDDGGVDFISMFAGKSGGMVSSPVLYTVGRQASSAVTADLDGDSRPDIAVANIGSNSVSLLLSRAPAGLPGAVSSASRGANTAPESLATLFASTPAIEAVRAASPWPTRLSGMSLEVRDSAGVARLAPLLYIDERQIDFQVPAGTALGQSILTVTGDHGVMPVGVLEVDAVAPALFTVSHTSRYLEPVLAAATAVRVAPDGSQTPVPVFRCFSPNPDQLELLSCESIPIPLRGDPVYLSFYGTGFRGADLTKVRCTINGMSVPVVYAGPHGTQGVDQINVRLGPELLVIPGGVTLPARVTLSLDGAFANEVQFSFR
jgi:uncharacterized protein (TIGR03437 family)